MSLSRFRYLRDGLFLSACALYAANRWVIKPLLPHGFFAWWANDMLLIPCAAPLQLWAERRLGLRKTDAPPTPGELAFLTVLWSFLFEFVAPRVLPWSTGDWRDFAAYAAGAFLAGLWWNRPQRAARR